MKTKSLKKVFSAFAILAVTATAALGSLSLVGGSQSFKAVGADTTINNKLTESEVSVYYVASEGTGDGSSQSAPMSVDALRSVLYELKPGDIVRIMPGVHKVNATLRVGQSTAAESGTPISGTAENYIIFEAADPSKETVLDFSEQTFDSTNRGVQIYGNYYYWHNIDICGAGDNGLYIGGSYNVVEDCEFYNNRDTGLQIGRSYSSNTNMSEWPSYNLVKNCTSHNNYDNETKGENADGFAAKLTVGYGNIFDGCIAYRNSDDGWDLYGKQDTGTIGSVIMYNCVAFENGYLEKTQEEFNKLFPNVNQNALESNQNSYVTQNGDGNGFKLGGSTLRGDVFMNNCLSFNNRMHGVTDNSNPGVISLTNVTSFNNSALIDNEPASATFGQIKGCDDGHNNIDLARSEDSYNNFSGVLSVFDGRSGSDAYKGAAEYSLMAAGSKWNKITSPVDADTISGKGGESVNAAAAADIFASVAPLNLGMSGRDLHEELRNEDRSVNLGDMFRIKDHSLLLGDEHKVGANLSLASYAEYPHPDYTYLTGDDLVGNNPVTQAAYDMAYVPVMSHAVYQDFELVHAMGNAFLDWTSSDPSVIEIQSAPSMSDDLSGVIKQDAIVHRSLEGDKQVTVTAKISGTEIQKSFTLTVKQNELLVGDIEVEGVKQNTLIVDQFSMKTTYLYSPVKGGNMVQVNGFTASNAGVYQITKDITCGGTSNSYTYTVYVVAGNAQVDFVQTPSVSVSYNGFNIVGELNNVNGTLYAMVAEEEPTAAQLKIGCASPVEFTSDMISAQFAAENNGAYTIYYAVANPNGQITSKIYSTDITVQKISTPAQFMELAQSGGQPNVIYQLTSDLDFSDVAWASGDKPFTGLLDGQGHTVKNITISGVSSDNRASIFSTLEGGTIANINFEEISIDAEAQNVGIIGRAYSGYVVNVRMKNVGVQSTKQRVGGLIGRVYEPETRSPLVIDRISIVNDEDVLISSGDRRVGGIIGFIQCNNPPKSDYLNISITNCFIDAKIGSVDSTQQVGGIIGCFDTSNGSVAKDLLTQNLIINKCYFVGSVYGTDRVSGIIGYQQGSDDYVEITDCVSYGDIYYKDATTPLTSSEKNASPIFGGYIQGVNTVIFNCYAKFEDHNSDYQVTALNAERLATRDFWTDLVEFDLDIWQFDPESEHYMSLR